MKRRVQTTALAGASAPAAPARAPQDGAASTAHVTVAGLRCLVCRVRVTACVTYRASAAHVPPAGVLVTALRTLAPHSATYRRDEAAVRSPSAGVAAPPRAAAFAGGRH